MPLTVTAVKNARPASKTQRLFDGGGLYLEVSPGGGKWWRLKYRFAGKEKQISLGVFPEVTLKDARDRRDDARRLLANDIDPSEYRKAHKARTQSSASNSFEVVAREWFSKHEPNWAKGHSTKIIQRLERDILPWIGAKPIDSITAPQLLDVIRRIEKRGALETAHRALANCGQVFRYAVATGRAERDLSGDLKGALPPVKTKHFAAVTEPDHVAKLLRTLNDYEGTLIVRSALRLAPLVFVRPGELRQAKWVDIDLEKAEWRFTVTKTDTQHIVPLSHQAVEILEELKPLTGHGTFVFPSARSPKGDRAMSDNAVLSAMRGLDISKAEMSGHGFRAMARTMLEEVLGFRPELIEHQLAHQVRDLNGRAYNRTAHLPERKKMMQQWANYLDGLCSDANVTNIRERSRKAK
jgi:integrase